MTTFANLIPPTMKTVTVILSGQPVTFTFNAAAVTLAWGARWDAAGGADALAAALLEVVHGWDIVNEDGTPDPLSAEHVRNLPFWAINEIQQTIMTAAQPTRAEGEVSSAQPGIPSTVSTPLPQTPPNGAAASLSPEPSASPSPT